jgi:hypothetical protein
MALLPSIAAKSLSKATALSVIAASGMILAAPGAANASPACGSGSYTISQLTAGFACTIADKEFSNFAFNGITTGNYGFTYDDPLAPNFGNGDHTFSGQGLNYRGTGFTYNYTVKIVKPGNTFAGFNTGFSTSRDVAGFTKELSAYKADGTTLIGSTTASASSANGAGYNFGPSETGPIVFKSVVTRAAGTNPRMDNITDSVSQSANTPPPTVPGPLPLLGAGAAFGMSRKLRRRISLA